MIQTIETIVTFESDLDHAYIPVKHILRVNLKCDGQLYGAMIHLQDDDNRNSCLDQLAMATARRLAEIIKAKLHGASASRCRLRLNE